MDEDSDDVHVTSPGGQVQREAAFAVGHVRRRLELQQLQHHVPVGKTRRSVQINTIAHHKTDDTRENRLGAQSKAGLQAKKIKNIDLT